MGEMQCITTPAYSDPSSYQLSKIAQPTITQPTDVIIQVHAASINPIDVKKAGGALKLAVSDEFPYPIGYDCAGIVTNVGDQVTKVRVGDHVYARLPEASRGSWAEYAKCGERFAALKPQSLSFPEAASLPLAAVTAMQALRKYRGSLEGKTVFIPAGLSGTGAYACQLAKNVFKAGKVITTVSTSKVDKLDTYLGKGVVDQVIDYTKEDPMQVIPPRSVDFILDTLGQAMTYLSLMTPSTSIIVSISTLPSGATLQRSNLMQRPDKPQLSWIFRTFLDLSDAVRRLRAWRWSVEYEYFFLEPNGKDLDDLRQFVEDGKVRPVIGSQTDFHDIEKVKEACWQAYKGKGGLGKVVIVMVDSKD